MVMLWTCVLNMLVQIVTETLARCATVLQVVDGVWNLVYFMTASFEILSDSLVTLQPTIDTI